MSALDGGSGYFVVADAALYSLFMSGTLVLEKLLSHCKKWRRPTRKNCKYMVISHISTYKKNCKNKINIPLFCHLD